MNLSDVAEVEELSEPELTHRATSAGTIQDCSSRLVFCLHLKTASDSAIFSRNQGPARSDYISVDAKQAIQTLCLEQ